jgi:hypothetical protein
MSPWSVRIACPEAADTHLRVTRRGPSASTTRAGSGRATRDGGCGPRARSRAPTAAPRSAPAAGRIRAKRCGYNDPPRGYVRACPFHTLRSQR